MVGLARQSARLAGRRHAGRNPTTGALDDRQAQAEPFPSPPCAPIVHRPPPHERICALQKAYRAVLRHLNSRARPLGQCTPPDRFPDVPSEKLRGPLPHSRGSGPRSSIPSWVGLGATKDRLLVPLRASAEGSLVSLFAWLRRQPASPVSLLTQSGRVRAQLGQVYPYTVGHQASRSVREARDSIRDLLSS